MDKLIKGNGKEKILQIINFALEDQFWQQNILTPVSLAKHFIKLEMQNACKQMDITKEQKRNDPRIEIAFRIYRNFMRDVCRDPYLFNQGELGNVLYGIAPAINIKDKAYFLPAIEGAGGRPNQFSLYSTFDLGHGRYVDINPTITKKEAVTSINLHKTHKGVTFGASTDFQNGKLKKPRDMVWRIAKFNNGNFIDLGVNFGKKKIRVAVQKAFR